jgi:hypothetical protein
MPLVFPCKRFHGIVFLLLLGCAFLVPSGEAFGQWLPTVQQDQFRSQWVGQNVDLIPFQNTASPPNGFGAMVGSLQTPDQLNAETEAALANVKAESPFKFDPSLVLGWVLSNQALAKKTYARTTNGVSVVTKTTYGPGNSPIAGPALTLGYERLEHGPWSVFAAYNIGYTYYLNPNFQVAGAGGGINQASQLNQQVLFKTGLEMSRYVLNFLLSASSGTGNNISTGTYTRTTTGLAGIDGKYTLSSSAEMKGNFNYNVQNNNNPNSTVSNFAGLIGPTWDLTDKTHLGEDLAFGISRQSFASSSTTNSSGLVTPSTQANQSNDRSYVSAITRYKYIFNDKFLVTAGLGPNFVSTSGTNTSGLPSGIRPAWSLGAAYTPTEKTSFNIALGEQGTDVRPNLNISLNWHPREKTSVAIAYVTTQSYSSTTAGRYLVSHSLSGTLTQKLFQDVEANATLGYTVQNQPGTTSTNGTISSPPSNYFLAQATLLWRINRRLSLNNTVQMNPTLNNQGQGSSAPSFGNAQFVETISLNLQL